MVLGALKLSNVAGPVRFQTSWGRDVEATDVSGGLELTVERGDVQVTASKGPVPKMDIHSRDGDIALALPEGAPLELNASTSQGEVENEFGDPLRTQTEGHGASIRGHTRTGPQITATPG